MTDLWPTPKDAAVSVRMRANRRRDTRPELAVRSYLHGLGLRYRVDDPIRLPDRRPVRPDVVFRRARVAFFMNGCFWHSCPEHGTAPAHNASYWAPKLRRNVERDYEIDAALREAGWLSLRYWEHDSPEIVAQEVAGIVRSRVLAGAQSAAARPRPVQRVARSAG